MTRRKSRGIASVLVVLLMGLSSLSSMLYAQNVKLEGVIKERSGDTLFLQTSDSPKVTVLLSETTDVGQLQGALKARNKKMSMAALIPGLPIRVEATTLKTNSWRRRFDLKAMISNKPRPSRPVSMKLRS
jgi:hypothetical protein